MPSVKRSGIKKKSSESKKKPPRQEDPQVFAAAFTDRLGQNPVTYLISKMKGGSDLDSIHYLFDIISAEIETKNNCLSLGYDFYFQQVNKEMEEMKSNTKVYNKLVRDRIPEIIEASGKKCSYEIMVDEIYLQKLDAKLTEELNEYQESKSLEELADLLEVMGAVVKARGYTWDDLTRIRKEKRAARGAFDKRILLKEVVE